MAEKKQGLTLDELQKIDPSGVIKLKGGKRYPLTKALISLMYRYGVESIETEMLEHDPEAQRATHRAVITGSRGMYTAHGDCCPKSVSNRGVLPHYQRISETRAIGRALRWYLGLGETVFDELGSMEEEPVEEPKRAPQKKKAPSREQTLETLGYTVEEINGLRAQLQKPPFTELTKEEFTAMCKWLQSETGRKAIHHYHIGRAENRRR